LPEELSKATLLRRLKTARGFERGDRLLQVACQVSALALDMIEEALCDASTYARRCASERALRLSLTANSASSHNHALGGQPRRPKEIEALASFKRSEEKKRAAQRI